ncbi:phosphoglucosamine mutase [Pelagibacteraceae bacterium]|nr:phosphoglucosamine mutase [Pelagibacteraceae bacterium]
MSKIFGTDGIRCLVNEEPLTAETCLKISKSVAFILRKKNNLSSRVVICKDTRLSGYLYEPLVTAGFISMGMDVILVGPLPTPAVPLMIKTLRADIGVMITASHNTYEYNGLKFFDQNGRKLDKKIEERVEKLVLNKINYEKIINKSILSGNAIRLKDASGRYSEYLKSSIQKSSKKKKLKIILDCGNGATYNIAPNLFWELGHEVKTINANPNGRNINKNCGAVDTKQLSKVIIKEKANIGFAFDGDGDRIIVVDENGLEIDGDKIIALFSKKFIKPKNKSNQIDVIITVMSNMALENYLSKKLKLQVKRTDVGDINVINSMRKYKSSLGGEQSGHIILSNFSNTGDGILAALKITEIMISSKLKTSQIFNLYKDFAQEKLNLKYINKNEILIKTINSLNKNKLFNNSKLRSLIRLSGTEPLVRILVEGQNSKLVKQNLIKIKNLIRPHLAK